MAISPAGHCTLQLVYLGLSWVLAPLWWMGARAPSPWGGAERARSGTSRGGGSGGCPVFAWPWRACRPRPLWGNVCAGCLLLAEPVGFADAAGGDRASVECAVAHPVGGFAMLTEEAVGCAVTWVTVGPVAVELSAVVRTSSVAARVVTTVVFGGDPGGNRSRPHLPQLEVSPPPSPGTASCECGGPLERAVCLPPADTPVLC